MSDTGVGLALVKPAEINLISEDTVMPDGGNVDLLDVSQENGDNIGRYVQSDLFQYYRNARQNEQEDICLDAERAYNNKYDLSTQVILSKRKAESGDSTAWVPYTRTKVNIAVAKTYEKMLNTSDNPWSIVPEQISAEETRMNEKYVQMAVQAGALQDDPKVALNKLNELSESEARKTCDDMEKEIADQLNRGKAFQSIGKTILQQHYLGTGVAKFEISISESEKWKQGPHGWDLESTEAPFPKLKFVSWFDVFFDPYAKSKEQSNGVIERHVMKRSDLLAFKSSQGFKEDKIKELIINNREGNHLDLDYETTIRGVNGQSQNTQKNDNYFDVYEAWIELPGDKLIEYGYEDLEGIEETGSYKVNCWVCDNITIKLIMNPHKPQKVPYFIVPYEENTSTINGTGIAEDLFGVQEVINSVTRASVDNGAFSHAPITEINVDMLKSGESPPDVLKPRGIYYREGGDPKEAMMRFHDIPENSSVLYNTYNMFDKIGEDATGIGGSTEESMPAANASGNGVSMVLSQKNILQRTVVGNIDKYLYQPMIEMFYNFNMQYSEKNDIKSPAKVQANGVTSIIAKEMRSQQLMAFAQLTNNEIDTNIVNRKEVLEELATSLDQDGEKMVYSDTDTQERNQQNQQAQMKASEMQQQSVIKQINAENQGELEQIRVKGTIDKKKQELAEASDIQQTAMKQEAEMQKQNFELFKQFQQMMQQQERTKQSLIQQQNQEVTSNGN